MSEASRVEAFSSAASRNPLKAMVGSAAVAAALAQGIPQLAALWAERGEAIDARVDAAYQSHLETLGTVLEGCEAAKQGLTTRLRECVAACGDGHGRP